MNNKSCQLCLVFRKCICIRLMEAWSGQFEAEWDFDWHVYILGHLPAITEEPGCAKHRRRPHNKDEGQRKSRRAELFTLNLMPNAESVADFSALKQLCTDVCFHHTFTISICSRNASRRLAFISACKTCPDALKCSPLAAPSMGGLY